jgi:hypothetical protein
VFLQYRAFGIAMMIGHVFDFVMRKRRGWAKQNMIDCDFSTKTKGVLP